MQRYRAHLRGVAVFVSQIIFILICALLFLLGSYPNVSMILGGVALFFIGMEYMERGFKGLGSGFFEMVLQRFTSSTPRALFVGFFITALVQSSSLVSIITISFLSAELMTLASGIGVIFGSNIGTTATAWLVSTLGVEIKISLYAMPMIILGVVLPMVIKHTTYRALAAIFTGLGIVFLGIGYMKDGFVTLKDAIDLAQYAIEGYRGIVVYALIGTVATVIMQSSSASMALAITALATGQIDYSNALAFAIGANIGTTVTAALGSINSNENGKRLAVAHFFFNIVTAIIAIALIYRLAFAVDYLAPYLGISAENYVMKLALFHTIFNIIGVILLSPFVGLLVRVLEKLFVPKYADKGKAKYLNTSLLGLPAASMKAITMETRHLYDNAFDIISRGLNLKKKNILSDMPSEQVAEELYTYKAIDIDDFYRHWVKDLYGDIIDYATKAQANMPDAHISELYKLKLACRDIVEAIKATKHLQKNMFKYNSGRNRYIREQYNAISKNIVEVLRLIDVISKTPEEEQRILLLAKAESLAAKYDIVTSGVLDGLIRKGLITNQMATSLMNDSDYANTINRTLIAAAKVLFIDMDNDISRLSTETEVTKSEKTEGQ